jgi:hypothetical protein
MITNTLTSNLPSVEITYIQKENDKYQRLLKVFKNTLISIPFDWLVGMWNSPKCQMIEVDSDLYWLISAYAGANQLHMLYLILNSHEDKMEGIKENIELINQIGFSVEDVQHYMTTEQLVYRLLNE